MVGQDQNNLLYNVGIFPKVINIITTALELMIKEINSINQDDKCRINQMLKEINKLTNIWKSLIEGFNKIEVGYDSDQEYKNFYESTEIQHLIYGGIVPDVQNKLKSSKLKILKKSFLQKMKQSLMNEKDKSQIQRFFCEMNLYNLFILTKVITNRQAIHKV